jgi:glycosidase
MIEDNRLRSQETLQAAILARLKKLYDEEQSTKIFNRLTELVSQFPMPSDFTQKLALSEKDAMLIAYGDHVQRPDEEPLITLNDVAQKLKLPISSLHILPFFPYSSDDGFSVIDYYAVDPDLGDWADIERLSHRFRLMFDAVFNHISAESDWFKGFLDGKQPYTDYFIVTDPQADLSLVTRPRTLPLLSPFETANGQVNVWTTFSSDQIDLNFANPDVLVEMMRILLFYVDKGTQFIRLDAIAYLWKQIGTTCIHLPETHLIIQLMRDVLDLVAPQTILLTETNVPHTENVSYFGDGDNEAQLVYQCSGAHPMGTGYPACERTHDFFQFYGIS